MRSEIREPTFLVLAALANTRLHGYGVIQEVERLSDGEFRLRAGTLYATLDRLTREGLVAADGEEVVDGRLRRYYRLTVHGSATLESESRRRVVLSNKVLNRLRLACGFA